MRKLIKHRLSNASRKPPALGVFGIPLALSLQYASVHATLTGRTDGADGNAGGTGDAHGDAASPSDVIVPIIVEKCATRLRDVGLQNDGIFRKPGAARRIAELQEVFDDPARGYGASFAGGDWDTYSAEDVADLLRRYLTHLPEPVIPSSFYDAFQEVATVGPIPATGPLGDTTKPPADGGAAAASEPPAAAAISATPEEVKGYAALIQSLPEPNRHLLLYLLDLLAAFAAQSEATRMSAASLAAVFHPGVLALPEAGEGLDASKHKQSQDVLECLIGSYRAIIVGR